MKPERLEIVSRLPLKSLAPSVPDTTRVGEHSQIASYYHTTSCPKKQVFAEDEKQRKSQDKSLSALTPPPA